MFLLSTISTIELTTIETTFARINSLERQGKKYDNNNNNLINDNFDNKARGERREARKQIYQQ